MKTPSRSPQEAILQNPPKRDRPKPVISNRDPETGRIVRADGTVRRPVPKDPNVGAYPLSKAVFNQEISNLEKLFPLDDPAVARHVAKIVFAQYHNYEKAAAMILPKGSAPSLVATAAHEFRTHPNVLAQLSEMDKENGLDDRARKHLIGLLWSNVRDRDPRKAVAALRMLAEATGIIGNNQRGAAAPADLPLQDLGKGLAQMGFDKKTLKQIQETPAQSFDATMELDDEEDE